MLPDNIAEPPTPAPPQCMYSAPIPDPLLRNGFDPISICLWDPLGQLITGSCQLQGIKEPWRGIWSKDKSKQRGAEMGFFSRIASKPRVGSS